MTSLLWAAFTSVWLLCLYLLLCTVIKREGKVCDCKRRRTIWLTIDKTCAFGSQVMISSQGTKSSFHSQCKFETGMVKKKSSNTKSETEWMSLFWHGFFTIYAFGIRFETSLGKPWVLIDAFFFFYFDDIQRLFLRLFAFQEKSSISFSSAFPRFCISPL